jgi:hypothetical protein
MLDEMTKSCTVIDSVLGCDPAAGREKYAWETTVAAGQEGNVHAHIGISEDEFVKMRTQRDATLCVPKLIIPSIQVNVFLKVPLNKL